MANWNTLDWTPEKDAAIRKVYEQQERGGALRLAQQWRINPRNISARAAKLGLPPLIRKSIRSDRVLWKADEILLVRKHSGEPDAQIRARLYAKGFSRSLSAVHSLKHQLRKTHQAPDRETFFEERNYLTVLTVAMGMGVNDSVVHAWIKKGWLKTRKSLPNTLNVIHYRDLRQFLIDHVACWDHRKVDRWFIVDVLANKMAETGGQNREAA